MYQANTINLSIVCPMSGQCRRRWANIGQTSGRFVVFALVHAHWCLYFILVVQAATNFNAQDLLLNSIKSLVSLDEYRRPNYYFCNFQFWTGKLREFSSNRFDKMAEKIQNSRQNSKSPISGYVKNDAKIQVNR